MNAHTPGPWEWDSDGLIYPEADDEGGDGYTPHIARVHQARPKDEFTGNLRLIAAAPDLLAALEAFLFDMADGSFDGARHENWLQAVHNEFCKHRKAARAAIAKARGE